MKAAFFYEFEYGTSVLILRLCGLSRFQL